MMKVPHILIVEDEPKVAAFIRKGLEENTFEAEIAYDGLMGKAMALSKAYDIMILDINLPQLNGFQLCKIIRENNLTMPIIMLTALGGLDEKVRGFDYGADDYLLKPFEFQELLARIKALLKRSQANNNGPDPRILKIADLEINRDSKVVTRRSQLIELTAKEYVLLEYLALNKGRVVSRTELSEHVWDVNFDTGTNVIEVYVNFLRKKMDNDFIPKLIHTRIGLGYVLKETDD
jgi:two-component system, OmpR family, copper resistance phosphate regulon response regulator CusR